jgi:hypothetical protein
MDWLANEQVMVVGFDATADNWIARARASGLGFTHVPRYALLAGRAPATTPAQLIVGVGVERSEPPSELRSWLLQQSAPFLGVFVGEHPGAAEPCVAVETTSELLDTLFGLDGALHPRNVVGIEPCDVAALWEPHGQEGQPGAAGRAYYREGRSLGALGAALVDAMRESGECMSAGIVHVSAPMGTSVQTVDEAFEELCRSEVVAVDADLCLGFGPAAPGRPRYSLFMLARVQAEATVERRVDHALDIEEPPDLAEVADRADRAAGMLDPDDSQAIWNLLWDDVPRLLAYARRLEREVEDVRAPTAGDEEGR